MNKYLEKIAEFVELEKEAANPMRVAEALTKKYGSKEKGARVLGDQFAKKHHEGMKVNALGFSKNKHLGKSLKQKAQSADKGLDAISNNLGATGKKGAIQFGKNLNRTYYKEGEAAHQRKLANPYGGRDV